MKNAMKKLMSLVLVAMILVSALPFAASAAGYDVAINVNDAFVYAGAYESISYEECLSLGGVDTNSVVVTQFVCDGATLNAGETVTLSNPIFVYIWTEEKPADPEPTPAPAGYDISIDVDGELKVLTTLKSISYEECLAKTGVTAVDKIVYEGDAVEGTKTLKAGETITLAGVTRVFIFTKKVEEEATKPTTPEADNDSNSGSNGGLTDYTKFAYPVYLNIYTDTTVGTVKKTVNITEGIAKDGVVTLAEVKSVVEYYYNSVDTDKGIQYDGLYPAQGNWVYNYVKDDKYERIEGLYEAAAKNYVYINVMIENAKLASSSTADSSNPKTGDAIFAPMAVMAVSASALALFFFYNKKRAI